MAWISIAFVTACLAHCLAQHFILQIDRCQKNLGKKTHRIIGIFKFLIFRSSRKMITSEPIECIHDKKIWVKDSDFSSSVSRLALLLQLLAHIYFIATIVLLILDDYITGISYITGYIGFILGLAYMLLACIIAVVYIFKGLKIEKVLQFHKEQNDTKTDIFRD